MAVLTPTLVSTDCEGSEYKYSVTFSSVSNNDTWSSGIKNVTDYAASAVTTGGTQSSAGCNVAYVASTGVFTFQPGLQAQAVVLQLWRS